MDEAGTTDWNVFLGWRELAQHCGMRACELSQRLVDLTWCIVSFRFDFALIFVSCSCAFGVTGWILAKLFHRRRAWDGREGPVHVASWFGLVFAIGDMLWWLLQCLTLFANRRRMALRQLLKHLPWVHMHTMHHSSHTHTYEQFHSVALRGLTTFIVLVSCCFIRMQNMSVPSCWTQLHASMWMHSNLKHQQWNFNFNHEVTCWWWHSYRHPSHLWSRTNCNWRTLTLPTYFAMSQYHDYTISIIGIYAHCITLHTVQVQLSMATNWSSQT